AGVFADAGGAGGECVWRGAYVRVDDRRASGGPDRAAAYDRIVDVRVVRVDAGAVAGAYAAFDPVARVPGRAGRGAVSARRDGAAGGPGHAGAARGGVRDVSLCDQSRVRVRTGDGRAAGQPFVRLRLRRRCGHVVRLRGGGAAGAAARDALVGEG